jgi:hypothetical protein
MFNKRSAHFIFIIVLFVFMSKLWACSSSAMLCLINQHLGSHPFTKIILQQDETRILLMSLPAMKKDNDHREIEWSSADFSNDIEKRAYPIKPGIWSLQLWQCATHLCYVSREVYKQKIQIDYRPEAGLFAWQVHPKLIRYDTA